MRGEGGREGWGLWDCDGGNYIEWGGGGWFLDKCWIVQIG